MYHPGIHFPEEPYEEPQNLRGGEYQVAYQVTCRDSNQQIALFPRRDIHGALSFLSLTYLTNADAREEFYKHPVRAVLRQTAQKKKRKKKVNPTVL
jgi:hypothetical protein